VFIGHLCACARRRKLRNYVNPDEMIGSNDGDVQTRSRDGELLQRIARPFAA